MREIDHVPVEAALEALGVCGADELGHGLPLLGHHLEHLYGSNGHQQVPELLLCGGGGEALYGDGAGPRTPCGPFLGPRSGYAATLPGSHSTTAATSTATTAPAPGHHHSVGVSPARWGMLLLLLSGSRCHGDLPDGHLAGLRGQPPDWLGLLRRNQAVRGLALPSAELDHSDLRWQLRRARIALLPLHDRPLTPQPRALRQSTLHGAGVAHGSLVLVVALGLGVHASPLLLLLLPLGLLVGLAGVGPGDE